jgi:hypothetical protein
MDNGTSTSLRLTQKFPCLQSCPCLLDYSVPFEIYTNASKYQIESVITQKDKPLAFYSRELTDSQTRYTVTELKLLAIVETLCE